MSLGEGGGAYPAAADTSDVKVRAARVAGQRYLAIFSIVVLWFAWQSITLGDPQHPHEYDPTRHSAVAEVLVRGFDSDGAYEYETTAVWYDKLSDSFYSLYDPEFDRILYIHNATRRTANFVALVAIAIVVSLAHWRLHRLGVVPEEHHDARVRARQRILFAPPVFAALVVTVAVLVGWGFDSILLRRARALVLSTRIEDPPLHRRFLETGSSASLAWRAENEATGLKTQMENGE